MLYPLLPGLFEHLLISGESDAWHASFADRINDLVDSGYLRDYFTRPIPVIRSIPVRQSVESASYLADSELVSELIDSHKHFAVYNSCPCRQSMHLSGHECGKASERDGCLAFGDYSIGVAADGAGRSVDKKEMYDIIAERRAKNLVLFTSNVTPSGPTAVCTCCDCCCRGLKINNSFGGNLVVPSHGIADVDESLCNGCGKCVTACNTNAHTVLNKKHVYDLARCVGCGNCVNACRTHAISMKENRLYRPPSGSYTRLIMKVLPPVVLTGVALKFKRYFSKK
jgi:ferredoxin